MCVFIWFEGLRGKRHRDNILTFNTPNTGIFRFFFFIFCWKFSIFARCTWPNSHLSELTTNWDYKQNRDIMTIRKITTNNCWKANVESYAKNLVSFFIFNWTIFICKTQRFVVKWSVTAGSIQIHIGEIIRDGLCCNWNQVNAMVGDELNSIEQWHFIQCNWLQFYR